MLLEIKGARLHIKKKGIKIAKQAKKGRGRVPRSGSGSHPNPSFLLSQRRGRRGNQRGKKLNKKSDRTR